LENLRWGGLPLVANSQLLAARGAAASQYGAAVLGFHANAKTMSFRAMAIVRLKSTFGHFSSIIQYKSRGVGLGIGVEGSKGSVHPNEKAHRYREVGRQAFGVQFADFAFTV
jgi:hypothetical protein